MLGLSAGDRLDPPRWRVPFPRLSALARAAAVAALLCLAAGALLSGGQPRPAPAPPTENPPVSGIAALPGTVGYPLRLADAGVATIVRPGQRVDVLSTGAVAENVLVLRAAADGDGALLYLGVTRSQADRLAALVPSAPLTVTVRTP